MDNNIKITKGSSGVDKLPSSLGYILDSSVFIRTFTIPEGLPSPVSCNRMFYGCSLLTSLDVSNLDTSRVINMFDMFYNCSGLASLDLSTFNTSEVTSMSYMFYGCRSLTSLDLSNFSTLKVTNMKYMFYNCSKLTSLDLSNFSFDNVTDTSNLASMLKTNGTCTVYVKSETDKTVLTNYASPTSGVTIVVKS